MEPAQGSSSSTTVQNDTLQRLSLLATNEDLIKHIDETAAHMLNLACYVQDPDELEQLKMEIAQAKQKIKENDYSTSSALENRPIAADFFGDADAQIKEFDEKVASVSSNPSDSRSAEQLEQLKVEYEQGRREYEQYKLESLQRELRLMDHMAFMRALLERTRSKLPKTNATTEDSLEPEKEKPLGGPGSHPLKTNTATESSQETEKEMASISPSSHPSQNNAATEDPSEPGKEKPSGSPGSPPSQISTLHEVTASLESRLSLQERH